MLQSTGLRLGASNAEIQDHINALRAHVRRYQETEDVFLLIDHYIDGNTKDVTRLARDKEGTKVSKIKFTSKLPAAKLMCFHNIQQDPNRQLLHR